MKRHLVRESVFAAAFAVNFFLALEGAAALAAPYFVPAPQLAGLVCIVAAAGVCWALYWPPSREVRLPWWTFCLVLQGIVFVGGAFVVGLTLIEMVSSGPAVELVELMLLVLPPFVAPLLSAWAFWVRDWERRPRECVACGYDLRGLRAVRCPECGEGCSR